MCASGFRFSAADTHTVQSLLKPQATYPASDNFPSTSICAQIFSHISSDSVRSTHSHPLSTP